MRNLVRNSLIFIGFTVISLWVLFPIFLITLFAFSSKEFIYKWPRSFDNFVFSLEGMKFFLSSYGVIASLINSIFISIITLVLTLLISLPAGYALSRFVFKGRETLKLLILLTRMFPVPLLSIPLAVSFLKIGLYDTILSVALLHTAMALPFACIIMIGVFAQISKELEEAAMVFGANRIKAFIKISLPLALPGIAAVSILTFITSWNEVFASAILTVEFRPLSAHILSLLQASPLHFKLLVVFS